MQEKFRASWPQPPFRQQTIDRLFYLDYYRRATFCLQQVCLYFSLAILYLQDLTCLQVPLD